MDLNPRAIELVFESRRARTLERFRNVGRRLRQHRLDGPKQVHPEFCKALPASLRHSTEIAGKHRGSTYIRRGQLQSLGNRFDHDQFERALTELTREQSKQKVLFFTSCSAKEIAQQLRLNRGRSLPCCVSDEVECAIDIFDLDCRLASRVILRRLERRPTHADLRLTNRAREIGDDRFDFFGSGLLQELGEELDLRQAARRRSYFVGSLYEQAEEHGSIAPFRIACSASSSSENS